jgi:hypothetical protein
VGGHQEGHQKRGGNQGILTVEAVEVCHQLGLVRSGCLLEYAPGVDLALEDSVDKYAGQLHLVGLDLSGLDELLDLGDADRGGPARPSHPSENNILLVSSNFVRTRSCN